MERIRSLPLDFVISYPQENSALAEQVLLALEREGLRGWTDKRYEPQSSVPIEGQLSMAWQRTRFVVALVPHGYRYSTWCRAEIEQARLAEAAVPITQLLVLCEGASELPEALRSHPSFRLDAPDGLLALATHIRGRRHCFIPSRDSRTAINRWQAAGTLLKTLRTEVSAQLGDQLLAVNVICSWIAAYENGGRGNTPESASLMRAWPDGTTVTRLVSRDDLLHAAFSDDVEVDSDPIQRLLYDMILVELRDATRFVASTREAIQKVVWDQLLVLACATNRYFLAQMGEVAEEISCEADFPLLDEAAQNHFLAVMQDWEQSIARAINVRAGGGLDAPPPGTTWASAVEHVELAMWHPRRSNASRLASQLPLDERVFLAGERCLRTFEINAEDERAISLSQHAVLLGLDRHATTELVHPTLAVEYFYNSLRDFLSRSAFLHFTPELVERLKERRPPFTHEVLAEMRHALERIIDAYPSALELWRQRRGSIKTFSSALVVDSLDCLIRPYTILHLSGVEISILRVALLEWLSYVAAHSTQESQALAELVASRIDRPEECAMPDFLSEMLAVLRRIKPH